ncbi:hypothetical protein RS030_6820 [Cryptosporidium xiaoi]|uniref:Uncharacterized protein n=1 Tax=Cryptosporidium xiaoi TaxID=659607 RepID=A0AAV9Y0H1_9CRYT
MVKCRGFKPGGIENPYYYRRKVTVPEGSSIKDKLNRSTRPTWEELRKKMNKVSNGYGDNSDDYEKNNEYKKKMEQIRKEKLSLLKKSDKSEEKHERSSSFDRSTPNEDYNCIYS